MSVLFCSDPEFLVLPRGTEAQRWVPCFHWLLLLQKHHSESRGTDQVAETQAQIDELKGIMVRNIGICLPSAPRRVPPGQERGWWPGGPLSAGEGAGGLRSHAVARVELGWGRHVGVRSAVREGLVQVAVGWSVLRVGSVCRGGFPAAARRKTLPGSLRFLCQTGLGFDKSDHLK